MKRENKEVWKKDTAQKKDYSGLRQASAFLSVPMMMVAGPLVGAFIGHWLDGRLGTKPYLLLAFLVLGFIAAGREVYKLIKWVSKERDDSDNDLQS